MADTDDKKVKELIDAATRADLERWFSLPSFEQLADRGIQPEPPPEDPELAARRRRSAQALAAVDPALLEALRLRSVSSEEMITPLPPVAIHADPDIAQLDLAQIDRKHTIAEPRAVEIPSQLVDDLRECTPQALLRDLHRSEQAFDKVFELVDPLAETRVDGAAAVAAVMSTRWKVEAQTLAHEQARDALREARALRAGPWAEIKIPSRRAPT